MIQNFKYTGIWFLPENEENADTHTTGTLTFDINSKANLELLGVLKADDNLEQLELILGLTSDGKKITLYKSFEYSRTISFPGLETSKYQPNYVLIGHHFKKTEDLVFYTVTARFKNFELWINKYGFDLNANFEIYQVQYALPKQIHFKINDNTKGRINFSFSAPFRAKIQKVTIEQKSELIIENNTAKPFLQIIDDLMYFQNFLTLGTFETAYPFSISLVLNETDKVEVFYKPNFNYIENEKKHINDFLFCFADIEENFENIITKWYKLKEEIEPIIYLLLDSFFNKGKFTENRFLNIVQGLETFHRRFKLNEVRPKKEHQNMIKEILDCVEEPNKAWLSERLHFSNEPTLHNRLSDLLEFLKIETIDKIVPDKAQFIKDTKNSRNYYTHYDVSTEKKALKNSQLFILTEKLRVILIASVLIETGFSIEQIDALFKKNEFRFFNHIIKRN